jgi:Pentapeptide repeats (9 copies)
MSSCRRATAGCRLKHSRTARGGEAAECGHRGAVSRVASEECVSGGRASGVDGCRVQRVVRQSGMNVFGGMAAMANPEHVEIVKAGAPALNEWRANHPAETLDLSKAALNGLRLSAIYGNQGSAVIPPVNLTNSNFENTRFRNSQLLCVDFTWSSLKNADFTGSLLVACTMRSTDLSGADFAGCEFQWLTLSGVELNSALNLDKVSHGGPSAIGIDTLFESQGQIPEPFLRGCGVPDDLIAHIPALTGEPFDHYSCFLSHSSKDEEFAQRLHSRL